MESRNAVDSHGNILGVVTMPEGTPEDVWEFLLSRYNPPATPLAQRVYDKLVQYENTAPSLLREIKTSNTLAGITQAQSAQMFTDLAPLILALREGAFPTALYMLLNLSPTGFITQPMLDDMVARITSKL